MSKRTTLFPRWVVALVLLTLFTSAAHAQTVFPEWASRRSRAWTGQPQLQGRSEHFARAAEPEGRLREALLLCRVHVHGQWDLFADPDLQVRATLGRRSVEWWGSENSRTEVFSVAGVSLRRGDRVRFRIVDRDVTFDDTIGTVSGRYDGGAISLASGQAEIECRHVSQREVSDGREDALRRAALERQRVEDATPDLAMDELGRPSTSTGALVEAATWSSWSHPAVAQARREHLGAEARFEHALSQAVRRAHRSSTAVGAPIVMEGGTARVESLECGRRARARMVPADRASNRCVVIVAVSGEPELGRVDVLTSRGVFAHPQARTLTGDDAGRVAFALPSRPPTPSLLRVGPERTLLRLR